MVADLVRARLRPEGYSLVRLMIGAGEVVGPLIAAALLAAGFGLPLLFVLAGAGCFVFLAFTVVALRETRPRVARHVRSTNVSEGAPVYGVRDVIRIPARRRTRRRKAAARAPQGYGRVLGDRRFCAFCAISLLPLFIFGQDVFDPPRAADELPAREARHLGRAHVLHGARHRRHAVPERARRTKASRCHVPGGLRERAVGLRGLGLSAFVPTAWPPLVTIAALAVAQAMFGPVAWAK